MGEIGPPALRPCGSCPYRRDVPSGVWAPDEYAKLRAYDADTPYQPTTVFVCHQQDQGSARARVCGGWAGCHDGDNLLALRIAVAVGDMTAEVAQSVVGYVSPVSLFDSGGEAAEHGLAEVECPGERATNTMAKIARVRGDLKLRED